MSTDANFFARAFPRVAILLLAGWCTQLSLGQQPPVVRMGAPDDWTHHHLIFSNPGTAVDAMQRGDYFHWVKVVNDPRFILQQAKRSAAARSGATYAWASLPAPAPKFATAEPATLVGFPSVPAGNLRRALARDPAACVVAYGYCGVF